MYSPSFVRRTGAGDIPNSGPEGIFILLSIVGLKLPLRASDVQDVGAFFSFKVIGFTLL